MMLRLAHGGGQPHPLDPADVEEELAKDGLRQKQDEDSLGCNERLASSFPK